MILKSIEEEAVDCLKRCADLKVGDNILHCHHEVFMERLTEPVENRISYIIKSKTDNVALRLRLMGPVVLDEEVLSDPDWKKAHADLDKADADWEKADSDCRKADADWMKADADCRKADADCRKANADLKKAYADWMKADADCRKADADWMKADADLKKAYADRMKADADCRKAYADRMKAYADREKANADWVKVYLPHYRRIFPDSPWDGYTIFAGEFKV